jgi:hypothetical protein
VVVVAEVAKLTRFQVERSRQSAGMARLRILPATTQPFPVLGELRQPTEGAFRMTLTIDLADEEVRLLAARARAQGLSTEQYARLVLEHDLAAGAGCEVHTARQPISQTIREIWSDMPAEIQAKLPRDGASEIDHYVYGLPKREQ